MQEVLRPCGIRVWQNGSGHAGDAVHFARRGLRDSPHGLQLVALNDADDVGLQAARADFREEFHNLDGAAADFGIEIESRLRRLVRGRLAETAADA